MSSDNIDTTSLPAPPVVAALAASNQPPPDSPVCVNGTARSPSTLPSEPVVESTAPSGAAPSEAVSNEGLPMETSPTEALPTEASPIEASLIRETSTGASPTEGASAEVMPGDEVSARRKAISSRNRNGRPSNINENSLLRRLECVMSVELGRVTMGTACEQYAISSRTFYRWLKSKDRLFQLTGFSEEDFKYGSPLQNAQRSTMQRIPRDAFRKIPTFLPATTRASAAVADADVDNLPRLPTQPKVSPNRSQSLPILSTSNHEVGLSLCGQDTNNSQLHHHKGPQVDIRPISRSEQHRYNQHQQQSSDEVIQEDRDQISLPDRPIGEGSKHISPTHHDQLHSISSKRRKVRTSHVMEISVDPPSTMTVKRPRSLEQGQTVPGMMVDRRNGSIIIPNASILAPSTSPTAKQEGMPSGSLSLPQPSEKTSNRRQGPSYSTDMLDGDWQTQRDDDDGEEPPDERDDPSTNVDSGSGSPAAIRRRRMEICNTVGGDEAEEDGVKSDPEVARLGTRSSGACDIVRTKPLDNSRALVHNIASSPADMLTSKVGDEAVAPPGTSEASLATRLVSGNDNASLPPADNINSSNVLEYDVERNMDGTAVCREACVPCHSPFHKHRIEVILDRRKATIAWYPGTTTSDIKAAIARRFALLPGTQWMLIDKSRDEIVISPGVPSGCYMLTFLS